MAGGADAALRSNSVREQIHWVVVRVRDGDITPVSRAARRLAAIEAMTGLLYLAVLIARLVSLYSRVKSHFLGKLFHQSDGRATA